MSPRALVVLALVCVANAVILRGGLDSRAFGSLAGLVKHVQPAATEFHDHGEYFSRKRPGESGAFQDDHGIDVTHLFFNECLSSAIDEYMSSRGAHNVVELGCGMGNYSRALKEKGMNIFCVDGNPHTATLTEGLCQQKDISVENLQAMEPQVPVADYILSLEVMEHIPKKFEPNIWNHLAKHASKGLVISWAVEGQIGNGHVNCRSNEYVIEHLEQRGFKYNRSAAMTIRERSAKCPGTPWFQNTLMVFEKQEQS